MSRLLARVVTPRLLKVTKLSQVCSLAVLAEKFVLLYSDVPCGTSYIRRRRRKDRRVHTKCSLKTKADLLGYQIQERKSVHSKRTLCCPS